MKPGKHLTLQDRQNIELMLNAKKDFTQIAQATGKNKSTISREIRARADHIRIGAKGMGCDHPGSDRRIYQELTEKSPSLLQAAARDRQLPFLHKKGPSVSQTVNSFCNAVRYSMVLGGEQTFLDVSALFTRSVNSWFSPFSGIQKRDQGAGCREAADLKNSKK